MRFWRRVGKGLVAVIVWTMVAEGIWLASAYTLLSPQITPENWAQINRAMQGLVLLMGTVFGIVWETTVRRKP